MVGFATIIFGAHFERCVQKPNFGVRGFKHGLLDMGVTEVLSLCAKKYRSQRHIFRAEEAILASIGSQQMHNMALHRDFQNQGRPYFWSVSFVILWH